MADRELTVKLRAQIDSYVQGMGRASRATQEFGREIAGQGKSSRAEIEKIGRSALIMGGALAGGLALSAKAAIDWESSFAGVTKTVDGTASEISRLEQGLRDMATELPASHGEIAAVAEAAGQLGVKVGDVESFTKVMIDLGETTNLTADQAATSLARISNIMGTSASEVDRMGSTIVALGNNSATTEAEIVELATRLAAAGKIAGLSEADVFAFASTLTSVGVEAEAGGTALSKVFTAVRDSVIDGGDSLETFAQVAGVTTSEFSAAFREDAAGAIQLFIAGLGELNDSGQSTTAVFDDLELADQRLMRALLSTASAGDLLTDQLQMSSDAWETNNALQTEAEKRYETTSAQLEVLKNKMVDLGIGTGDHLLPVLSGAADAAGSMADGLGELPGPLEGVAVGLAGITATGLTAVGVVGTFGPKIAETKKALEGMGAAGQFASRNIGKFAAGMGAAGVALAAYSWYLGDQAKKQAEAEEAARRYTEAIKEQGSAIGELTDEQALLAIVEGDVGEALRRNKADLDVFTDALRETPKPIEDLGLAFDRALGETAGQEVLAMEIALRETGLAGSALADELLFLAESSDLTDEQLEALTRRLSGQAAAHREGAREAENDAAATETAGTAAAEAVGPTSDYTDALEEQKTSAEDLEEAIKAVSDAYRSQVDPIFAAQDALADHAAAQQEVLDAEARVAFAIGVRNKAISAHGKNSKEAKDATRDLRDAENDLEEANRDVVRSTIDVATATAELKMRMDEGSLSLDTAIGFLDDWVAQGLLTEEQAAAVAEEFNIVAWRAAELGGRSVEISVDANTDAFYASLREAAQVIDAYNSANGINLSVYRGPGSVQAAAGGIMEFANGGMSQAHIANQQIVKYAEPETGGEAYIPRFGDTSRSLGILQEAAGWYGATVSAGGGVTDNRSTTVNNYYPKPEPASDSMARSLRKASLVMAGA